MNTNEFRTKPSEYSRGLDPHLEKRQQDERKARYVKLAVGASAVAMTALLANNLNKEVVPNEEINRPGVTVTVEPGDTLGSLIREQNPNADSNELDSLMEEAVRENPNLGSNNPTNPQISSGDQLVIPYTPPSDE